jgi:MFS family permease
MQTASRDAQSVIRRPLAVLRAFDPQLKRLLAADSLARLAEGMPRELIPVFCVAVLAQAGGHPPRTAWALFGTLLIVSQFVSAVTYLPMGYVASKAGFGKRPYIGWTFFFFASFPAVLAAMGFLATTGLFPGRLTLGALGVAFVFAGLREIGEPARKAMIVELVPAAQKTQAIGIYWSARCVTVMLAPLVGGGIWVLTNLLTGHGATDATGPGPLAMLLASSLCGTAGVVYYYARFGKPPPPRPAETAGPTGPAGLSSPFTVNSWLRASPPVRPLCRPGLPSIAYPRGRERRHYWSL